MLKKILFALLALIVVLLIVVVTRPSDFRITRKAVIAAPAAAVFEQLNDFQKWNAWWPWAKLDPKAKNSFEVPASGVGAKFSWAGNSEVGEGSMKITASKPGEKIVMDLVFIKPFAGSSVTEFTLKAEDGGTEVTWTMSGKNGFVGKAISLFMNCDKMVGSQFEEGFANLKRVLAKP